MGVMPGETERFSTSVLSGLDSTHNPIVVGTIIPNYSQSSIVTIGSLLPQAEHFFGTGTYETTLARVGRIATGLYISPDFGMLHNEAGVVLYLAKAIPDATPLQRGYSWQSPTGDFDSSLSNRQRIIAFGTTLLKRAQNQ